MNSASRTVLFAAVLSGLSLLAACGANPAPTPTAKKQETSFVSGAIEEAITEARKEIAEGNITVSKDEHNGKKAEITPKGDLLIDGKAVAVTPAQRALLLEYRGHVVQVATAGMHIGMESADLATKAVAESLKGVFTGNTDDVEKRVEAEADKVREAAKQLCGHLPGMLASQQKLAAALPEFRPYATMDQSDVDDCHDDTSDHASKSASASEPSKQ